MIVHKITKPFKFNIIQQLKDKYLSHTTPTLPVVPLTPRESPELFPMLLRDKVRYSKWLDEVKQTWELGSLATVRSFAVIPGRSTPPPVFLIHGYEEMRHLVQWDNIADAPKCIRVIPYKTHPGTAIWVAPSFLRTLTPEERALVDTLNFQDTSSQVH